MERCRKVSTSRSRVTFFDILGSRVREAGAKPALPRNCKRRCSSALPLSQKAMGRRVELRVASPELRVNSLATLGSGLGTKSQARRPARTANHNPFRVQRRMVPCPSPESRVPSPELSCESSRSQVALSLRQPPLPHRAVPTGLRLKKISVPRTGVLGYQRAPLRGCASSHFA